MFCIVYWDESTRIYTRNWTTTIIRYILFIKLMVNEYYIISKTDFYIYNEREKKTKWITLKRQRKTLCFFYGCICINLTLNQLISWSLKKKNLLFFHFDIGPIRSRNENRLVFFSCCSAMYNLKKKKYIWFVNMCAYYSCVFGQFRCEGKQHESNNNDQHLIQFIK